jgi:hypothetical protein
LLAFFFPNINVTPRSYDPITEPIPSSDRMKIITDVNGITWLIDSHLDTVRLHDPAWFGGSGGGNYSLSANGDSLFLNENNIPIDTIIFSIQSPPDSAFLEQGKLIFPWDGNYEFADSINIGIGLPVLQTNNIADTVTLDFSETSVHRYIPTGNVNHIRFTGLREGFNYILDYQGAQTITLSDSLQWVRCGNNLRVTGNTVISFYCAGDTSYVYSNDDNLECYAPSIGAGLEYQAVLDQATAQSNSVPSLSMQTAQNTLINELVASGAWPLFEQFFCLVADGDSDFSLINWKTPGTLDGSTLGTPIYTSMQGWSADETTDAINTNFVPSDGAMFVNNSATVGMYIEDMGGSQFYFGSNVSPNVRGEKWSSTGETHMNGVNPVLTGSAIGSGRLVQHSLNGGNLTTYRDGVVLNTAPGTGTGRTNTPLYLMNLNLDNSGTPWNNGTRPQAKYYFWYVGSGDLDVLADEINTAITNYLTAIGL